MKIIAIGKDYKGKLPADFEPFLKLEAKKVWELYQNNKIREIYFREDQNDAVLILECESIEEAKQILSELPLVKENLIHFELIPLRPYPGFERLFESNI